MTINNFNGNIFDKTSRNIKTNPMSELILISKSLHLVSAKPLVCAAFSWEVQLRFNSGTSWSRFIHFIKYIKCWHKTLKISFTLTGFYLNIKPNFMPLLSLWLFWKDMMHMWVTRSFYAHFTPGCVYPPIYFIYTWWYWQGGHFSCFLSCVHDDIGRGDTLAVYLTLHG